MTYSIEIDTRAWVVHSDTGCPVVECRTHTEAANVAACLTRGEDQYHVQPFADIVSKHANVDKAVA
jgi:hypothetical protein